MLNQYINVFGADYPDAESFAENLVNYEDVLHSVLEKERPGTAAAYDLKFYTFLKEGKHERLIHLFYELSFSDRNDFLIQLFMKENWQEELIKFYLIEDLPEEFSFRSSVFILRNSVPESYFRLEFCLQGNASVTKSYYDDQYEKGQKNVLLLAKAAVYGKLDEVKYENFNAEIGFTLTGDQKEVWKENSKKQQYGLKATENTDFESCMKIGAVPTWTCMNYKSGQYNECLLSVFDANKKVLYVDKGSKCVARAIMRLTKMSDTAVNKTLSFRDVAEDAAMESGSDEKLVIFLERMYFSHLTNAEIIQVRKLLYDLAEAKATALGAKILVAQDYEDIAEEKLLKKTSTNVYISKSKNGDQYLDSLGGECEKGGYYVKGNFYAPYEQ